VTAFDFGVLGIIGVSFVLGLMRGLIKELLSLVAYGLAFLAAVWWGPALSAQWLLHWVKQDYLRIGIAYFALFVATLLAVGLVNMALAAMVRGTGLSPADRGLGGLFGIVRGVLLVLIIVTLVGYTPLIQEPWWKDASLSKQVTGIIQQIGQKLPAPMNEWLPF
jgi:membrane protein required for colicin V production